jgi:hypothetical protein
MPFHPGHIALVDFAMKSGERFDTAIKIIGKEFFEEKI